MSGPLKATIFCKYRYAIKEVKIRVKLDCRILKSNIATYVFKFINKTLGHKSEQTNNKTKKQ
jgi:hypothetical protein